MNGPRLDPLLLVFVHPGTQGISTFISVVPPPSPPPPVFIFTAFTFFPSPAPLSPFLSSSLDNFVGLVVMLLSF